MQTADCSTEFSIMIDEQMFMCGSAQIPCFYEINNWAKIWKNNWIVNRERTQSKKNRRKDMTLILRNNFIKSQPFSPWRDMWKTFNSGWFGQTQQESKKNKREIIRHSKKYWDTQLLFSPKNGFPTFRTISFLLDAVYNMKHPNFKMLCQANFKHLTQTFAFCSSLKEMKALKSSCTGFFTMYLSLSLEVWNYQLQLDN